MFIKGLETGLVAILPNESTFQCRVKVVSLTAVLNNLFYYLSY